MCGRFTLRANLNRILQQFAVEAADGVEWEPRFNIAPSQQIPIIKAGRLTLAKWGLIPSWADDPKIGYKMINARAEGLAEKPSFRSAFKKGRCVVITDGFYEWKKLDAKNKQPYFIRMKNNKPFAFAGLSECWDKGEKPIESATIITTTPNSLMAEIHDRMPVILSDEARDLWLDPEFQGKDKLLSLLEPCPDDEMVAIPVSTLVNSPKNENAKCIEPA